MTNLTNYHSHCLYCDGRANMEDFIRLPLVKAFLLMAFLLTLLCHFLQHGRWSGTGWMITFPNFLV